MGCSRFHDLAPSEESFREAVLAGLSREPKTLPCKFFYDARGSALFEQICEVPGVLPDPHRDRDPRGLCRRDRGASGRRIAGSSSWAAAPAARCASCSRRWHRPRPTCRSTSRASICARRPPQLAADFPELPVIAVCADYTRPFRLPPLSGPAGKRVGFFPGSTIGNFEPEAVVRFLDHCAELLGPGGGDADRRRPQEGPRHSQSPPTTTAAGHQRRLQPQPAGAHQSRARRRFRPRPVRASSPSTTRRRAGWSFT